MGAKGCNMLCVFLCAATSANNLSHSILNTFVYLILLHHLLLLLTLYWFGWQFFKDDLTVPPDPVQVHVHPGVDPPGRSGLAQSIQKLVTLTGVHLKKMQSLASWWEKVGHVSTYCTYIIHIVCCV